MAKGRKGASAAAEPDGRRRRTLDSRGRIIAAMLELTEGGQVSVSAEAVADKAQVGLRTVFRHFKDMDSLYREMSLIVEARLAETVARPFAAADWRGRLAEIIQRRASVFEAITPFKRAEAAQRHRSRFLESDIQRLNARAREILLTVLPASITDQSPLFEALDLLLSFEAWDRLRREQGLSRRRARDTLANAVERLVGGEAEQRFFSTERLVFRKFEASDLEALAVLSADPEVIRYVGDGVPLSRANCALWIERSRANVERFGYGTGAVVEQRSGAMVGWAGFARPEGQPEELIYGLGKTYWGQGLGAELLAGLLAWATADLGMASVRATVVPANVASVRMLEREGFKLDDPTAEIWLFTRSTER